MEQESPSTKLKKDILWKAGINEIIELDKNRENDIETLNTFVTLNKYFKQQDVTRLLYIEEWRSEREEQVLNELEKFTTSSNSKKNNKNGNYHSTNRRNSPPHGIRAKRLNEFIEIKRKISKHRELFSVRFQKCFNLKLNASVALQRSFKRFLRKKKNAPHVTQAKHDTILKKYAAKRIQKFWHFYYNKYKWHHEWELNGGHEAYENMELHHAHDMHLLSGEGLSGVYNDENEKDRSEMKAELIYDVIQIQKICRRWLAKRYVNDLKLKKSIKERNRRRNVWRKLRGGTTIESRRQFRMKHDEIITWYVNVKNECARVDYELQLEQKRMGKAWKKWDTQMTKIIMARPLGKEWLPQVDNDGNTTSYLNLNTGHEQIEHPFMRYIKAYRKREYVKAQEILNERVNHLKTYKNGLLSSERKHRMILFDEAEALS